MFYVMGMTKKFLWFILWGMDHISSKLHLHHQHLSFFTLHYCITLTWNVFRDTHFSFMLDFSYWKGPSHSDTFRLHHAVFIFSVLSFLSLTTLLLFFFFFATAKILCNYIPLSHHTRLLSSASGDNRGIHHTISCRWFYKLSKMLERTQIIGRCIIP